MTSDDKAQGLLLANNNILDDGPGGVDLEPHDVNAYDSPLL